MTASSFVDAWNWAAYGPNAALNSHSSSRLIVADVRGEFDDEGNPVSEAQGQGDERTRRSSATPSSR